MIISKNIIYGFLTGLLIGSCFLGMSTSQTQESIVVVTKQSNDISYAEAIDAFKKLHTDSMSSSECLEALRVLAQFESQELGIAPPSIAFGQLENNIAGVFNTQDGSIRINEVLSDDGEQLTKAVFHEVKHAADYAYTKAVQLLPQEYQHLEEFKEAHTMSQEFGHYVSSQENSDEYRLQLIEQRADRFSEVRYQTYIDQVTKRMKNTWKEG